MYAWFFQNAKSPQGQCTGNVVLLDGDDITRSQQSANAINKIYGQDAVPIVYGYRIHEDQMRLAQELGVQVYLDPDRD